MYIVHVYMYTQVLSQKQKIIGDSLDDCIQTSMMGHPQRSSFSSILGFSAG